eukprot:2300479-Pyramimonas_sp.AAC.1
MSRNACLYEPGNQRTCLGWRRSHPSPQDPELEDSAEFSCEMVAQGSSTQGSRPPEVGNPWS